MSDAHGTKTSPKRYQLVDVTPIDESHPSADTSFSNILIVDPDSAEQLVLPLKAQGYLVHISDTAKEALTLIQQGCPSLILIEVQLADLSGFELCLQLKQNPRTRHIPVLFVGRDSHKSDRLTAFEVGGVDFIAKPYWHEEVVARVKLHASQGKVLQQMRHQAYRSLPRWGTSPLLATLQKTLHQQSVKLQEKNIQLEREIQEREQAETALRHEQQKSDQLLRNILPAAIVNQLKQFQGSLAQRFDETTVMFADIVNFTPLAAQVQPLELVNLLNQIFSAFDRLVDKYQLEKIKTVGDAYMVVGGVPVPRTDHAVAIADMALEMQTVIQKFRGLQGELLQIRTGINTGTVVAGVIGIKKFSYDLWGDTVNVASRMESHGAPGKIQVTQSTYQRLKETFIFEPAQEVIIKGKGPMATYYLIGRR
ncbi:MAG: adenylate/guanylate cyclase domain-containing protein [Leptolyngbyaceae cyanobacterium]